MIEVPLYKSHGQIPAPEAQTSRAARIAFASTPESEIKMMRESGYGYCPISLHPWLP